MAMNFDVGFCRYHGHFAGTACYECSRFKPIVSGQTFGPRFDTREECEAWIKAQQAKDDPVNSPPHYTGDVECIDGIKSALGPEGFKAFCRGNALKYAWRAGKKGSEAEDMQKASWYSRMAAGDDPRAK